MLDFQFDLSCDTCAEASLDQCTRQYNADENACVFSDVTVCTQASDTCTLAFDVKLCNSCSGLDEIIVQLCGAVGLEGGQSQWFFSKLCVTSCL
jgi:hypothetical protein